MRTRYVFEIPRSALHTDPELTFRKYEANDLKSYALDKYRTTVEANKQDTKLLISVVSTLYDELAQVDKALCEILVDAWRELGKNRKQDLTEPELEGFLEANSKFSAAVQIKFLAALELQSGSYSFICASRNCGVTTSLPIGKVDAWQAGGAVQCLYGHLISPSSLTVTRAAQK